MQINLLLILPFILFFSYHPVIPLGSTENMNLELSLPLIWLALYAAISLPQFFSFLKHLGFKKSSLLALFPLYLLLSLFWSSNPLRTILTAGIIICLIISVCTFPELIKKHPEIKSKLASSLLLSAVLVSIFCWAQCLMDVAGIGRSATLLCEGCTYQSFGFPHPNGFAIEPQFMGSLLLAPIALSFYLLFIADTKAKKRRYLLLTFFLTTTLFLVFSRGAIYSFLVVTIVAIAGLIIKKSSSSLVKPLLAIPIILLSLITALFAQGIFAELSPTSEHFSTAIAKSIHQLSLGKLDFRSPVATQEPANASSENTASPEPTDSSDQTPHFSGYVAESTDYRLSLNEIAVKTWSKNPKNILLGVGLGAAGPAMYQTEPSLGSPKEIVQNEYISILLELGLFGMIFCFLSIFALFISIKNFSLRSQTPKNYRTKLLFLGCLTLAFLLSLNFFSGLPNALHIYLLIPLGLVAIIATKH